jgi:hypothetical protein
MIGVTELQLLAVHINKVNLLGRGKPDVRRFAGSNVTDNALDKCAEIAGCAVLNVENDGRIAVVTDRHAFAEVVCCCHWESPPANTRPAAH